MHTLLVFAALFAAAVLLLMLRSRDPAPRRVLRFDGAAARARAELNATAPTDEASAVEGAPVPPAQS